MTKWHLAAWFSGIGCLLIAFLIFEFRAHRQRVAEVAAKVAEIHDRESAISAEILKREHEATRSHISSVMDDGVRKDVEITKTRMGEVERLVQKIATFFGVKL